MFDDDAESSAPILACGHQWDRKEDWDEMLVILAVTLDEPEGPVRAVETPKVQGERLASLDEAWAWLGRQGSA